jgi:hypothetical protein
MQYLQVLIMILLDLSGSGLKDKTFGEAIPSPRSGQAELIHIRTCRWNVVILTYALHPR